MPIYINPSYMAGENAPQPIAEAHKQRCKAKCNSTLYYYLEAGISLQCRHCKSVVVIPWEELLRKYQELWKEKGVSTREIYDGQVEGPNWELVHKAFGDVGRWLKDAPTPEVKKYRMGVILEAFSGKPIGNEEWDTSGSPDENPFALDRGLLGE